MQQWKEDLESQVNETIAIQRALEEEAAGVSAALGNITSSLHQLAPAAVSPSPEPGQILQSNRTTEVSVDGTYWQQQLKYDK